MDAEAPPQAVDYFEHDADIGVVGRAATLEAAFAAAARAVFMLMTDLDAVAPHERVEIDFREKDAEMALVIWLNALLGQAAERGLVLSRFEIAREGDRWHGSAWGERWREDLVRGVEAKGATLTALRVRENDGLWEARCVIDV